MQRNRNQFRPPSSERYSRPKRFSRYMGFAPKVRWGIMKNKYFIQLLLFMLVLPAIPATASIASAQVAFGISIGFAPPPLPVYEQPICPGDGYIWTPGYWAYDYEDEDYYWVPGTWVIAPRIGFLWTPGYWGWGDEGYFWHGGYWGENVGFC